MSRGTVISILNISKSIFSQLNDIDDEDDRQKADELQNDISNISDGKNSKTPGKFTKTNETRSTKSQIFKCAIKFGPETKIFYFTDVEPKINMQIEIFDQTSTILEKNVNFRIIQDGDERGGDKEFLQKLWDTKKCK